MKLTELIGIVGGVFYLLAFYRTVIGKWTSKSLWYELDNLFGAVFLSYYTWQKGAYVSLILNIIWGVVAFVGVDSIYVRHDARKKRRAQKRRR